jgi:hypothetical protein
MYYSLQANNFKEQTCLDNAIVHVLRYPFHRRWENIPPLTVSRTALCLDPCNGTKNCANYGNSSCIEDAKFDGQDLYLCSQSNLPYCSLSTKLCHCKNSERPSHEVATYRRACPADRWLHHMKQSSARRGEDPLQHSITPYLHAPFSTCANLGSGSEGCRGAHMGEWHCQHYPPSMVGTCHWTRKGAKSDNNKHIGKESSSPCYRKAISSSGSLIFFSFSMLTFLLHHFSLPNNHP